MAQVPTLTVEQSLWSQGKSRLAGIDEAGLGSLAGPIVAAAVVIPQNVQPIPGVADSKQVTAKQRERLFEAIHQQALAVGVGIATVAEIDRLNVLQASYLAMRRALDRVQPVDHSLIDGRAIKRTDLGEITTIIDGDASSYAIACASIIAKVRRDRFMRRLAQRHPGYGWEKNAGYGTQQHRTALQERGVTPWHRKSYAPVQQVIQQLSLWEIQR